MIITENIRLFQLTLLPEGKSDFMSLDEQFSGKFLEETTPSWVRIAGTSREGDKFIFFIKAENAEHAELRLRKLFEMHNIRVELRLRESKEEAG